MIRRLSKRGMDLSLSIGLLVLASPLLAVVALLIRLRLGSPVLFRQERPGLHGERFWMLKFRTMTDRRDAAGRLLPDDQRLTALGRFLRRSSLDELPELWNVIRGQMSLVGPRPLLPEYLEHYTPQQARRHDVLPGVTGWAQVNGRNALSWERKFELDVWYVDHQSLALDLKILWLTVLRVLRSDGISSPGHATMPRFDQLPAATAPQALAIIGAGGHAKVVIEAARAAGLAIGGVYDDNPAVLGGTVCGVPVRGAVEQLSDACDQPAVIAIGDCRTRALLAARLPCRWVSIVHPSAVIAADVQIGPGTVVMAGAVIQPGSTLGQHVIVNTAASVDHDCRVDDFAHLAPGVRLAGGVTVERQAFCGIGSVALPGVRVGQGSVLGAGAVAVNDLPPGVVAVGVPARVRRSVVVPAERNAA